MTKKEAIELVESSVSSILTREDVMKLINDIDAESNQTDTDDDAGEFNDHTVIKIKRSTLLNALKECISDELQHIDLRNDAEVSLSMGYNNCVIVDDIDYSYSDTIDSVVANVEEWLDNNANTVKA
jgi:hypothetical protein